MPEDLAELAHRNLIEVLRLHADRSGGRVGDDGIVFLTEGPHPGGVFVNSAVPVSREALPAEVLARTERFFADSGARYEFWLRPGVDDALEAAALDAGMSLGIDFPVMVAHAPPPEPEGFDLRWAQDEDGIEAFLVVSDDAWRDEDVPDIPEMIRATFAEPERWLRPDTDIALGYLDGEPQAAAVSFTLGEVAYLCWVGTREAARGRGLGGAVSAAATRAGFERGARLATLEATDPGAPVYRRLGYETVGRYRNYWFEERPL